MSENKKTTAKKISPAKERAEKVIETVENTVVTTKTGVSAPQVVFLSLLTYLMLAAAVFAFRDHLLPYTHQFLGTQKVVETSIDQSLVAGFVPIPVDSAFPSVSDTPAPTVSSEELNILEQKQTALTDELGALRAQMALLAGSDTSGASSIIDSQFEQKIDSTEASLSVALDKIRSLEAKLTEVSGTTANLSEQISAPSVQSDMRGLIAFQTLQSQALSGQAFQASLQRVIALLPDSASIQTELDSLEKLAPLGRPLLPSLAKDFQAAISAYMRDGSNGGESFLGKVQQNLSSFVRVRRTDIDAPENDIIISAAEAALGNGNVKGAYAELLKLDESAKPAFAEWMLQARDYHQLPENLQAIQLELTNATAETNR